MTDNVVFEQKTSNEEIIYRELTAIYLETQGEGYVSKLVWERVNALLRTLSSASPRYAEYYLVSENAAHSILAMTFRQKLRSAIAVMSAEYGLEDLTDIIRKNRQETGMNVHNNATSNPVQNVSQNVETSIEQKLFMVANEIERNLTDEQVESIKPLIEDYKKKPTRIATEKLVGGILGFGKDVAVGIISNIISKQIGI